MVDHLLNQPVTLIKPQGETRYGEEPVAPVEFRVLCRASDVQINELATAQGARPVIKRRFYFPPETPVDATDQIICDGVIYRIVSVASSRDLIGTVHHLQVDGIGVSS